jgi:nicotinate phosphoribosyltransferase
LPRRKRSVGKATWPGRKQVWRRYDSNHMAGDIMSIEGDVPIGEPLLQPVLREGRRLRASPTLTECRMRAAENLARLPEELRRLKPASYPVEIAPALSRLAAEVDERLAGNAGGDRC